MSYEVYRTEIAAALMDKFDAEMTNNILTLIDAVSVRYDIEQKSTALIVRDDDVPQIVKYYIASKAVENKSRHTLDAYRRTLTRFLNRVGVPFDAVTANDIRAYLFEYKTQRKIKDSSLDRIRSHISTFYKWCVDEERMVRNPAAKIGPIKHQTGNRDGLTALELETLRTACKNPREKAIVDFLYSTGCRVSELCALRKIDISFEERTVTILHGKGDKRRTTYINAEAEVSLRAYLATRKDDCMMLFVNTRGQAHGVTPKAIQETLNKITARTSLQKRVYPHLLRHTAATTALRSGMPVEQVQRFLGHSQISTTMIYAKVDDADVKRSHEKYVA